MAAEFFLRRDDGTTIVTTPAAGYTGCQVVEHTDGRAAVVIGQKPFVSGDLAAIKFDGKYEVPKVVNQVWLKGDEIYFSRAARACTPLKSTNVGDFYVGVATADAAAADVGGFLDLNVKPRYYIDHHVDPFEHLLVKTVVGSTTVLMPILEQYGGVSRMAFGLTAEAQKLDLLSKFSVPVSLPWILTGRFAIYDIGDAAAADFNIGIASATHASDADAIPEHCFLHLDGNSLVINAQSKDSGTTVPAATTGVSAVDDTFLQFAMDGRDLSNIKLYIAASRVLSGSTFKLNAATGPLKVLAHMEKTADDTPGDFRIADLQLRVFDVL